MAVQDSAAPPAGQSFLRTAKLRAAHWLLERKLSRRSRLEFARVVTRALAIRIYSVAACFISMLLIVWAAAFAGAVSAHHWQTFRMLNETTLLTAAAHAGTCQRNLLPVILFWSFLLLFTPGQHTVFFPAAVTAAGVLGYYSISPPPSNVTASFQALSHWLTDFETSWSHDAILFFIASIGIAYILQYVAVSTFKRLPQLYYEPGREYELTRGLVPPDSGITIASKMPDGRLYIDGARSQYLFPFGARAHIEIAQESLKLFL